MTRITSLNKEQEELMSVIRDEWIKIALDTSPVDKEKAEAAINLTYEIEEEDKPKQIIWFDNPVDAAVWIMSNIDKLFPLKGSTRYASIISNRIHWTDNIIDVLLDSIYKRVNPIIEDNFYENFNRVIHRKYLGWTSNSFLADFIEYHLSKYLIELWGEEQFLSQEQKYKEVIDNEVIAIHDIYYLALSSFYHSIGIDCSEFKGYWATAQYCGLWWAFVNVAVVVPKPSIMNLDSEYRLYAEGKPALVYPGFEYYYPIDKINHK